MLSRQNLPIRVSKLCLDLIILWFQELLGDGWMFHRMNNGGNGEHSGLGSSRKKPLMGVEDILFFSVLYPWTLRFSPPGHVFYPWTSIKLTLWTQKFTPRHGKFNPGIWQFCRVFQYPWTMYIPPQWAVFSGRAQSFDFIFNLELEKMRGVGKSWKSLKNRLKYWLFIKLHSKAHLNKILSRKLWCKWPLKKFMALVTKLQETGSFEQN